MSTFRVRTAPRAPRPKLYSAVLREYQLVTMKSKSIVSMVNPSFSVGESSLLKPASSEIDVMSTSAMDRWIGEAATTKHCCLPANETNLLAPLV